LSDLTARLAGNAALIAVLTFIYSFGVIVSYIQPQDERDLLVFAGVVFGAACLTVAGARQLRPSALISLLLGILALVFAVAFWPKSNIDFFARPLLITAVTAFALAGLILRRPASRRGPAPDRPEWWRATLLAAGAGGYLGAAVFLVLAINPPAIVLMSTSGVLSIIATVVTARASSRPLWSAATALIVGPLPPLVTVMGIVATLDT